MVSHSTNLAVGQFLNIVWWQAVLSPPGSLYRNDILNTVRGVAGCWAGRVLGTLAPLICSQYSTDGGEGGLFAHGHLTIVGKYIPREIFIILAVREAPSSALFWAMWLFVS